MDVAIPVRDDAPEAMAYLGGHTLGQLLRTEAAGTEAALARAGRMTLRLECGPLDAEVLAREVGGRVMGAFVRATKPVQAAPKKSCCGPECCH